MWKSSFRSCIIIIRIQFLIKCSNNSLLILPLLAFCQVFSSAEPGYESFYKQNSYKINPQFIMQLQKRSVAVVTSNYNSSKYVIRLKSFNELSIIVRQKLLHLVRSNFICGIALESSSLLSVSSAIEIHANFLAISIWIAERNWKIHTPRLKI